MEKASVKEKIKQAKEMRNIVNLKKSEKREVLSAR